MYANYLIDVGKLVFIVGQPQTTSHFRTLFQAGGNNKQKIFYKCMQEIPTDTFKKEKPIDSTKGIIRKDWFNKILNKNPQMIVITFNCTAQLTENEVWDDRLKVMIKKINRVFEAMKSNNKEQVRLRIIILISKHTFGGVNLHQKITTFLKNYEKQLFIIQMEYYAKQLTKIRAQWIYALQKNYDNKYKKIEKRRQQSDRERRLGCSVKMAILSQVLTKKDQKERYKEAYKSLRNQFLDSIKSVTILNHEKIRELRAVGDVVFLRYLKCQISTAENVKTKSLFDLTFDHMNFFKLKNLGPQQTNKYFYYEELLWRCTFIESFLQLAYKNDLLIDDKTIIIPLCELLNEVVTYLYALGTIDSEIASYQKSLQAKQLKDANEDYVGLVTYKVDEIAQTDLVYTFLTNLTAHSRDFLSKGIQVILRFKTMNIFQSYQILFLNNYLLKFYIKDNKISSAKAVFEEIIGNQKKITNNMYLTNRILKEIDEIQDNETQNLKIQAMAVMVCDYFEDQQKLQHRLLKLLRNEQSQTQNLNQVIKLKKNSLVAKSICQIEKQFVHMQQHLVIKLKFNFNEVFKNYGIKIRVIFSNSKPNHEFQVQKETLKFQIEKEIAFKPIQKFSKQQNLKIQAIILQPLGISSIKFVIPQNQINFTKFSSVKIFSDVKCPEVDILLPYNVLYINEITHFAINIQKLQNFKIQAKFSIKEQDAYGKTEVFADLNEKINLINCNYYQQLNMDTGKFILKIESSNIFSLKCNKLGDKSLKLTFHLTVQKNSSSDLLQTDSNESLMVLKQTFTITRQLKFTIKELFQISKKFTQFSNDDSKPLQNRNIPVAKQILAIFQLTSDEDVLITEMGQHKNPKNITYLKQVQKRDLILKKSTILKLNSIFEIPSDCADQIQLFLSSLYIKWKRISSIQSLEHQNLFLDQEIKINCFTNELSLFVRASENFLFKKNELNKITLFAKNHSKNKCHLFVVLQGNNSILRVGEKGKQIFVDPQTQKSLEFDVLPIISGFLQFPAFKVFVNGVERNLNIKNGQVIKCF